jgi:hypothetical protein
MRLNLDLKQTKSLLFGICLLTVTAFSQTGTVNVSAGMKVSGEVTGILLEQQVLSVASVYLLPQLPPGAILNTQINGNGSFEFSNVLPGKYNINVQFPPYTMKEPTTIVVSDHDLTDIKLVLINTETSTRLDRLEPVWSLKGGWRGLIGDGGGSVFVSSSSNVVEIDSTGMIIRQLALPPAGILRLAHFTADGEPALLAFATWSPVVRAYSLQGNLLWTYPEETGGTPSTGTDDVWPLDMDGDKSDEVIVGFNGSTGLHVINSEGKLIWHTAAIGNVWHVAGGDVLGNNKSQVVTTSATGQVHLFSADGKERQDIYPGFYANMVRVAQPLSDSIPASILAIGNNTSATAADGMIIAALAGNGAKKWSVTLESGRSSIYSASVAQTRSWLAAGMRDGRVYVIDIDRGAIIGQVDGQGLMPDVVWVNSKESGPPLLIVSAQTKLNAYRITGSP